MKEVFFLFEEDSSILLFINVFVNLIVDSQSVVACVFGQKLTEKT